MLQPHFGAVQRRWTDMAPCVEAVGDATEIGKVARQSTEQNTEPTPLNIPVDQNWPI